MHSCQTKLPQAEQAARKKMLGFQHMHWMVLITNNTMRGASLWSGMFYIHFPTKETVMDVNNVTGGVVAGVAGVVLQFIGLVILILTYGFYLESFLAFWILGLLVAIGGIGFAGLEVVREKMNE